MNKNKEIYLNVCRELLEEYKLPVVKEHFASEDKDTQEDIDKTIELATMIINDPDYMLSVLTLVTLWCQEDPRLLAEIIFSVRMVK